MNSEAATCGCQAQMLHSVVSVTYDFQASASKTHSFQAADSSRREGASQIGCTPPRALHVHSVREQQEEAGALQDPHVAFAQA